LLLLLLFLGKRASSLSSDFAHVHFLGLERINLNTPGVGNVVEVLLAYFGCLGLI